MPFVHKRIPLKRKLVLWSLRLFCKRLLLGVQEKVRWLKYKRNEVYTKLLLFSIMVKVSKVAPSEDAPSKLTWGLGIEHEALPLYAKLHKRKLSASSRRLYPVRDALTLTDRIWAALGDTLSDEFGRDALRYPMNVTGDSLGTRECLEFSTRDWKNRTLIEYVNDLVSTRDSFMQDLNAVMAKLNPHRALRDADSKLEWPTVGADYLLYPKNKRYVDIPRYLGSYHINVTLPHHKTISNHTFVLMHQKAAIALQWIEPLLMAMLSCPHPSSVFDGHAFTELSVRHAEEPLAMALSRDIIKYGFSKDRKHEDLHSQNRFFRKMARHKYARDRDQLLTEEPGAFDPTDTAATRRALAYIKKSIKERAKTYPLWLKLVFKRAQTSPIALKHFIRFRYNSHSDGFNEMPVIGTDFRRDSSKGARFGFEFRLLDYFPPDQLVDILRLMFYVMDCSHDWPADKAALTNMNAHANKDAHLQMVECILEGWNTVASPTYLKGMSKALSLPDLCQSGTCADAMESLQSCLFKKFGQGKGAFSRYLDLTPDGKFFGDPPKIPNINKVSWDTFFEKGYAEVAEKVAKKKEDVDAPYLLQLLGLKNTPAVLQTLQEDVDDVNAYRQSKTGSSRNV